MHDFAAGSQVRRIQDLGPKSFNTCTDTRFHKLVQAQVFCEFFLLVRVKMFLDTLMIACLVFVLLCSECAAVCRPTSWDTKRLIRGFPGFIITTPLNETRYRHDGKLQSAEAMSNGVSTSQLAVSAYCLEDFSAANASKCFDVATLHQLQLVLVYVTRD
jgi:hypothetical protein